MSYELFETPKDAIQLLLDLIIIELGENGMSENNQAIISERLEKYVNRMNKEKEVEFLMMMGSWFEDLQSNMKYWGDTMEINTCCANSECGAYQKATSFLRSHGIEPSIEQEENSVCLKINFPEDPDEKRKFILELEKHLTLQ